MKTGPKDRSGNTPRDRKPPVQGRKPPAPGRKPFGKSAPGRDAQSRPSTGKPGPAKSAGGPAKGGASRTLPAQTPQSDTEIICGRNSVREALRAGRRVRRLFVLRDSLDEQPVREAVRLATERRIPVEETERWRLDGMAPEHQGLAALVGPYQYASWGELLERLKKSQRPPAVLLLDTLHDPQNFGTLMRTSDVLGLDAVVLPRHRSVHVTPAVVRASAGAVEHLAIPVVSNLVRAIEELQQIGFWVAGLDMDGDRLYSDLDMTGPTAIVLGGEDHGLGRLVKEKCDFLVRLPMGGHVSSLNASVAGSVVLYEMARQRRLKAGAGAE